MQINKWEKIKKKTIIGTARLRFFLLSISPLNLSTSPNCVNRYSFDRIYQMKGFIRVFFFIHFKTHSHNSKQQKFQLLIIHTYGEFKSWSLQIEENLWFSRGIESESEAHDWNWMLIASFVYTARAHSLRLDSRFIWLYVHIHFTRFVCLATFDVNIVQHFVFKVTKTELFHFYCFASGRCVWIFCCFFFLIIRFY